MNGLPDFYGHHYPSINSQRAMGGYAQQENMEGISTSVNTNMLGQPQTLDQIMNQNNQEMMRRRQTSNPHYRPNGQQEHARRASMMEFGTTDLDDFQFDPNPTVSQMPQQMPGMIPSQKSPDPRRVRSREDLNIDTRFSQMTPNYNDPNVSYSPAIMPGSAISIEPGNFMSSGMQMPMNFDVMTRDHPSIDMQSNPIQQPMYSTSPVTQTFPMAFPNSSNDSRCGNAPQSSVIMAQNFQHKKNPIYRPPIAPSPLSASHRVLENNMPSPAQIPPKASRRQSIEEPSLYQDTLDMTMQQIQQAPLGQGPMTPAPSKFKNAYSTSGFDMLGVLMRVATRRRPEINIGPVDLSCAFVVCDIEKHDMPIVYCSDMFERLTGYTRYEILGRNCRFLQAPDGKVQSGVKRKYVDDRSVLYLKNQISKRAEGQLSLINYRKGGQPFMNLLTMIPIIWDTEEFKYYVGFQVDLVEQPNSVSGKNPDGTYAINYNRSAMPAYSLPPPPDPNSGLSDMGQTIPRDEVSRVLQTIGTGESELSRRIWDKVLLENTDDIVHVLSLKGLFLYLSPASRKVLEYDATELVGTPLSSICHPSDIVPVTRELKDSSGGAPVNVVYRIRRKTSGYTWFEAHGCLHSEQGKGRKCIILVGRERPVYALDKSDISTDGGIGDSELWSKLSTTGMFLYVSSNSRAMLDRIPEDLIGTSLHSLMRPESKKEFMLLLEVARVGEKGTFKHDLQNRRGQVLQAQTTIYPGDAKKGSKPTFLLAQTRLLKMTRAALLNHKSVSPLADQTSLEPGTRMAPHGVKLGTTPAPTIASTESNPNPHDSGVVTQAGGMGLPLGNQDEALASEDNMFDELKTTRSTSWQFELRQMERRNRMLAEELQGLISRKKKRKRRKGLGQLEKDCANCHTRGDSRMAARTEWSAGLV